MSIVNAIALLLLGITLGTALGWALATARAARLAANGGEVARIRADAAGASARAQALEQQLRTEQQRTLEAQQRARQDGAVLTALEPVREQLEHMALRVEQMELQRSKQNAVIAQLQTPPRSVCGPPQPPWNRRCVHVQRAACGVRWSCAGSWS